MPLSPLLEAARDLEAFLVAQRWQFCFIGGLAVLRWGEPRLTFDVDVTLLCQFGREDEFAGPLLAAGYHGRIAAPKPRAPTRQLHWSADRYRARCAAV